MFSSTVDGILAALLAPLFMSLGFFLWDCRWTSSGASAFALNMYKCNVASIGFIIMCLVRGFAISTPSNESLETAVFTTTSVGFLILSSTLGIIVGDVLWLEALRLLGAKHVIVIDSLKPFMAAILGWVALEEVLLAPAWGGMALTVIGVGVVAWEEQQQSSPKEEGVKDIEQTEATSRIEFDNEKVATQNVCDKEIAVIEGNSNSNYDLKEQQQSTREALTNNDGDTTVTNNDGDTTTAERKHYKRGYLCAIVNVLADSLGSLLTKMYGVGMTTWSINLIRFGFAGVVLLCISTGMRLRRHHQKSQSKKMEEDHIEPAKIEIEDSTNTTASVEQSPPPPLWFELPTLTRIGWLQITAGVGLVTFLCPALSNYALFQIALGLAVSLGSIGPLYGLLLDWPFKGKRPTMCMCVGVLMAVAGVVILCVWGT